MSSDPSRFAVEEFARAIVSRHLDKPVSLHDDNSRPGMVDLVVGDPLNPESAIEVVGVMDSQWVETWNIGPADGPIELDSGNRWKVVIDPATRVKRLRACLPDLLGRFHPEVGEWIDLSAHSGLENPVIKDLANLGVVALCRYPSDGAGAAYLTMRGFGGGVPTSGDSTIKWLDQHLKAAELGDVQRKLLQSGCLPRELFLIFAISSPVSAFLYLNNEELELPSSPPDLPSWLDAVWLVSLQRGIVWRNGTWAHVNWTKTQAS